MKIRVIILSLLILVLVIAGATAEVPSVSGALRVEGTSLVDQNGAPVQLSGLSTHGIAWFPDYVNSECFAELKEGFGIDLIRLAMYTAENLGYCTDGDSTALTELVCAGIDYAIENDLYVIADWHILSDNDPRTHAEEAKEFFTEISTRYANVPNVIYEICNEPNSGTTWEDIREYALEVIPVIRAASPDAVIIVGTPDWCQRPDLAAKNPIIEYDNIMYALHFYSASHKQGLRDTMAEAVNAGLPVFISEFGVCSADGNGEYDLAQANAWMDITDELNISRVMWNISNKDELSAIFKSDCEKFSGFTPDDLTPAGLWLAHVLHGSFETGFEGMDERPEPVSDADNLCGDASGWGSWIDRGAGADADVSYENGVVTANVRAAGNSNWFVQPSYSGLKLEQGAVYELTFTIRSTEEIRGDIQVQQNYSPYGAYLAMVDRAITPEAQTLSQTFTMTEATDGNVSLVFNIGANDNAPYTVEISGVSLKRIG